MYITKCMCGILINRQFKKKLIKCVKTNITYQLSESKEKLFNHNKKCRLYSTFYF